MYPLSQQAVPWIVDLGALVATATRSHPGKPPFATFGEVVAIHLVEAAAVTGDNTNRYSFSFNKGTIGTPTAIATLDLVTGVDLVANTPYTAVTMPTGNAVNDAKRRITNTDVLHVVATKNGSAANTVDTKACFWVIPVYDHANQTS